MTGQEPQEPQESQEPHAYTEEELQNLSEEELQALYMEQYNAEMSQLRVEDLIAQTVITLVNLGGRRAGLAPGTEGERDPAQLKIAIDGAMALLPLIETQLGPDGPQIREALSQLQMAFVQISGSASEDAAAGPGEPPASRLWVPGQ